MCGSQRSSSSSSLRAPTAIPNTSFGSRTGTRPVSSNSNPSISPSTATDYVPDLIDYDEPSNLSSVNLNQNPDPKLFSSSQAIFTDSSSHSIILSRPASKPALAIPHPTIPPPSPPLSSLKPLSSSPPISPQPQSGEIWSSPSSSAGTKVTTTTTAGHLTFDIPGE